MEKLTEKQEETFKCIKGYILQHRISPTIRELRDILGKNSTSTIKYSMDILKRKGYIDFEYGKNRTIKVLYEE